MVSRITTFTTDQGLTYVGPNSWPNWADQLNLAITIPQALELISSLAEQINDDRNAYAPQSEACIKFELSGKITQTEEV